MTLIQQCVESSWTEMLFVNISNNNIFKLRIGKLFSDCNKVERLTLGYNNIKTLTAFHGLQKLTVLDLDDNRISVIPDAVFQNLRSLKELSMQSNKLKIINLRTFYGLESLETLKLAYNNISIIPNAAFQNLTKLEELQMNNNKITTINPRAFHGLQNLETLNMNSNNISDIPDVVFQDLSNLITITMFRNNISQISSEVFKGLTNLMHLYLEMNPLLNIHWNAFCHLTSLQDIHVSNTQNVSRSLREAVAALSKTVNIDTSESHLESRGCLCQCDRTHDECDCSNEEVPRMLIDNCRNSNWTKIYLNDIKNKAFVQGEMDHFEGCNKLKLLDISRNDIKFLKPFPELKNFTILNLSFNNIYNFTDAAFQNLTNLEELYLQHNKIKTLNSFPELKNFTILNLSFNNIYNFTDAAFQNITNLEELYLQNNKIKTLNHFHGFKQLKYLNLSSNDISAIGNDTFGNLIHLQELYLDNNEITNISSQAFKGLMMLSQLNLSNNPLHDVHWKAFCPLPNLKTLYIFEIENVSNSLQKAVSALPTTVSIHQSNTSQLEATGKGCPTIQMENETPMKQALMFPAVFAMCTFAIVIAMYVVYFIVMTKKDS